MYLSVATRSDITHAVNFLSHFNKNRGKPYCIAAKKKFTIPKKCSRSRNWSLSVKLIAFDDADWASDVNDTKSYTAYIYKISRWWDIHWNLKNKVALSTTEAEYMVLSEAPKGILHLRRFLSELSLETVIVSNVLW